MEVASVDTNKEWTVEDYLQLEEGLQAQLIDGKLIVPTSPSTSHQRVLRRLTILLDSILDGETFFSPIDLYLDKTNVLQPDLVFVSGENKDIITERGIEGIPDLIVEIISPSNSFIDRNTKRLKYLKLGVKEYWIIDGANRTLEIYKPGQEETPELFIAGESNVKSSLDKSIDFDLSELLDR